ncbi:hypothetical protein HY224_02890 [Candidatus Uhrbacteria bacterium]|nr:hypothetical protein [Candidatus Uhrbacteria bacterium]
MSNQTQQCKGCSNNFQVTSADRDFYGKMDLPTPKFCPDCRFQQRISWRNERVFYPRTCDNCKKNIISIYAPNSGYTVYCSTCWWGDTYDPLKYGQAYDLNRPFFEQFGELDKRVPKLGILNAKSTNSDYTHYSAENKDCYMIVGSLQCERCYYCYRIFYSKDVVDGYDIYKCELCYQCVGGKNLYNCDFCVNCRDCSDVTLSENCNGCSNCFGCVNLRNKQFYVFNQAHSEQEYKNKLKEIKSRPWSQAVEQFQKVRLSVPFRSTEKVNCQNSSGDQLLNCKECQDSYVYKNSEHCNYCKFGDSNKDCLDINFGDNCELNYNATNLEKNYNVMCSVLAWYNNDAAYCSLVFNSNNIFGCSGLKKQELCILNKQYSEEEYLKLRQKIVESMKKEGTWGDFLPVNLSPFSYNESIAHEYFPLKKEEVLARGWRWQDQIPFTTGKETKNWKDIPTDIGQVPDSICNEILRCEKTGKNFRISRQELDFYRKKQLPLPRLHPDVRFAELRAQTNGHKLFDRQCAKCQKLISTTYAPSRPERVYCEQCYQAEIA